MTTYYALSIMNPPRGFEEISEDKMYDFILREGPVVQVEDKETHYRIEEVTHPDTSHHGLFVLHTDKGNDLEEILYRLCAYFSLCTDPDARDFYLQGLQTP